MYTKLQRHHLGHTTREPGLPPASFAVADTHAHNHFRCCSVADATCAPSGAAALLQGQGARHQHVHAQRAARDARGDRVHHVPRPGGGATRHLVHVSTRCSTQVRQDVARSIQTLNLPLTTAGAKRTAREARSLTSRGRTGCRRSARTRVHRGAAPSRTRGPCASPAAPRSPSLRSPNSSASSQVGTRGEGGRWNEIRRRPKFLDGGASSFQLTPVGTQSLGCLAISGEI